MKCILCVAVYVCVFSQIVYGARSNKPNKVKEVITLEVDSDLEIYGPDQNYLKEGIKKKITCKGSQKYQKIDWFDPEGNLVPRNNLSSLVYTAEPVLSRTSALILVFDETQQSQSGVWECRSGDMVQRVTLCIMDPAEFIDTPKEITMDEGRSITLTCQSNGSPEPQIQWYKDGQLLVDDDEKYFTSTKFNQHGYEGLLTVKSLTAEDMGDYICEATQENPRAEDCNNTISINITLNVNHAPKLFGNIPKKDEVTKYMFAQEDENVTLFCDPSAYPMPEFRWFSGNMATEYKHFKVTEDGTTSIFFLTANSTTFDHKFKCKAKNRLGEINVHFLILRLQKPEKLSATSEFFPRQRTMYFNISQDQEIMFPIDGINIQYFEKDIKGEPKEWQWESAKKNYHAFPEQFDSEDSLVPLKNLKLNTEYWVRLRASNDLGKGPWSNHMLVSTVFDGAPQTAGFDIGIFLGVIVTCGIVVFAAACITVIKKI